METIQQYKPVLGYKGLTKDMKATSGKSPHEIFELGKVYYKENKESPNLCTEDGYHFCKTLEQVFSHYPNNGDNRFFKIEILGNTTHGDDKSITTAFRLVEEVSPEALKEVKFKNEAESLGEDFNLSLVRFLQTKYPHIHVGGSTGLFLHGLWLSRWKSGVGDLDLVAPFYTFFEGDVEKEKKDQEFKLENKDGKASGNDFDQTFFLNGKKVDVRIDPKQSYDIIQLDGFRYKVSKIETILAAKLRYAMNGQAKHRDDIFELVGKLQNTHNKAGDPIKMVDLYKNIKKHEYIRNKDTKTNKVEQGEPDWLPF